MRVQIDLHAPVFKQSPIDDLYALAAKAVSLLGEPGNNAGHSLLAQPRGCLSALARRPMRTIALIARRGGFIFISLIAVPLLRVGQRNTPSPFPSLVILFALSHVLIVVYRWSVKGGFSTQQTFF